MKIARFMLPLVLAASALHAQAPPLPLGPGSSLPAQPAPLPAPEPDAQIANALSLAETLRPYGNDLLVFFGGMALVFAGYHAQFAGLQPFVSTALRLAISFALLNHMGETIPVLVAARDALDNLIPAGAWTAAKMFAVLIPALVATSLLTGPFGIGLAMVFALQLGAMFILWRIQALAKPFLVALAPIAIGCLAFDRTAGIFQTWLKTLIAVLLIPVAWHLALYIGNNLVPGGSLSAALVGIANSLTFLAGLTGIYLMMPVVTFHLVNSVAGAVAGALPNPTSVLSSFLATYLGSSSGAGQLAGVAGKAETLLGGGVAGTGGVSPSTGAVAETPSSPGIQGINQRVADVREQDRNYRASHPPEA